jgi:hypothetical protein
VSSAIDAGGFAALGSLAVVDVCRTETMLGLRMDSSWKCDLPAMRSLENSLGEWVPATTGAVKRGHRAWQLCRNEGSVRAADLMRESWTAAQNRVHKSFVSCCVVPEIGFGGAKARIRTNSGFVYGGKWR